MHCEDHVRHPFELLTISLSLKKGEPEEALVERVPLVVTTLLQVLAALVDTQYSSAQKNASVPEKEAAATGGGAASTTKSPTRRTNGKKSPATVPVVTGELTRLSTVPANLVAAALKALLARVGAENVVERMNAERAWTNILNPLHFTGAVGDFINIF